VTPDTLDALLDRLLPGAVEGGVRRYIEQIDAGEVYAGGLAGLEAQGFATLSAGEQDAILAGLEGEPFFELVRKHVLEGMFGDPRWGGNADRAGWELLGYPGPRREWGTDDQRLEVLR
jgi:hypothetical protein